MRSKPSLQTSLKKPRTWFYTAALFLLFISPMTTCTLLDVPPNMRWIILPPEDIDASETATWLEPFIRQTEAEAATQTQKYTEEQPYREMFNNMGTQRALDQTHSAKRFADMATEAAAVEATQHSQALTQSFLLYRHKPVILYVDFPTTIPNDKSEVKGSVKFMDNGRDVNWAQFDVVSASQKFDSGGWDPEENTQYSDYTGIFSFTNWCEGNQIVTQRITLRDSQGNTSDGINITFTCK
jgi:hypothetical protein